MLKTNLRNPKQRKMETFNKIFCSIFGHNYKLKRRVSNSIAELYCKRCKSEFGINISVQSLLPLDKELIEVHSSILNTKIELK